LAAKLTSHFSPIVSPFPARGLSRRMRGAPGGASGNLQSRAKYNKLTRLRYIRWHQPPGPMEEEEEEEGGGGGRGTHRLTSLEAEEWGK
jgi:hypothetical protein